MSQSDEPSINVDKKIVAESLAFKSRKVHGAIVANGTRIFRLTPHKSRA
jgi:hypothetical protein